MKILIIGGTGFIGPHIVTALSGLGHTVVVFHRGRTQAALPAQVRHIYCPSSTFGDRQCLAEFAAEFAGYAPDVVLDMIPVTEADARTTMDQFRGLARRIVAISSQDVYRAYGAAIGIEPGPVEPTPLSEDAPLRRRLFPYRTDPPRAASDPLRWMDDYDKILVERTVLGDPNLPGTILRLPMVYGPRDRQHRLFEYVRRMDDRRPAILLEESLAGWRWTRGYVEDVAAAVVHAVTDERAAGRVYNVGEADALSTLEWVRLIARAARWDGEVIVVPADRLPEGMRERIRTEHDLVTDSSRIRAELGYEESVSRDEAIARTVAWERRHPPEARPGQPEVYAAEDAVLESLRK